MSGNSIPLSFIKVWSLKKSFNIFVLAASSVIDNPLCSRGGRDCLELGEITDLRVRHQSLDDNDPVFNLFAILFLCDSLASLIYLVISFLRFLNLFQCCRMPDRLAFLYALFRFLIRRLMPELIQ